MDKTTRAAIEKATQRARKLLEADFAEQLEGTYDVLLSGQVAPSAGPHLTPRQRLLREKIVAAVQHKQAAGMKAAEAVADSLRDAAFTALNRFVALKMLEARGLVQECISKGEQSSGYREFCGLAPGVPLLPNGAGYRLYLECILDELSTEVKVLFDRRDAASVLWPHRRALDELLETLNGPELAGVWQEDETIGWVYQYFNSPEERRAMRDASQAPRNSRELAIRNQFFTPRYVVQFLTDNTLGRIWYEMRQGQTRLVDLCEYMVRRPEEEYEPRPEKDPRDLRILDPACGSGHFLLYAFDLLLVIYEEAWEDAESTPFEETGRTLRDDYPTLDEFRRELPGLILRHNLHGVDIDPRCAQIAQLALWMRAQRAFRDFGIPRAERPLIRRSNIVMAEPMPGEADLRAEFLARLADSELATHFERLAERMKLAGEMGLLLRVEELLQPTARKDENLKLFAPPADRLRVALGRFADEAATTQQARRRLFRDDSAQGLGLAEITEKRFEVVLMNPPFGLPTPGGQQLLFEEYHGAHHDIFCAFVRRGVDLITKSGLVGCISSRSFLMRPRLESFRREDIIPHLALLLDLGSGVMDTALVDACVYTLAPEPVPDILACDLRRSEHRSADAASAEWLSVSRTSIHTFPQAQILYQVPIEPLALFRTLPKFEDVAGTAREGMKSFDNERFLRLWWEVPPTSIGRRKWARFAKGGPFSLFYGKHDHVLNWNMDGAELKEVNRRINGSTAQVRQASSLWFRPGATYTYRSSLGFGARVLPRDFVFSNSGPAILIEEDKGTQVGSLYLLGWLNARLIRALVHLQANAGKFLTGIFKNLPWVEPTTDVERKVCEAVRAALTSEIFLASFDETSPYFCGPATKIGFAASLAAYRKATDLATLARSSAERDCSITIDTLYGIDSSTWASDVLNPQSDDDEDSQNSLGETDQNSEAHAFRLVSFAVGLVLGRWASFIVAEGGRHSDPFASLPGILPVQDVEERTRTLIGTEDEGHPSDIVAQVVAALDAAFGPDTSTSCSNALGALRDWFRDCQRGFFAKHLQSYSSGERAAPIYWRLSSASGAYAVWLYYLKTDRDTLFSIQSEFIAAKLAHETRKTETLRAEHAAVPGAIDRKQLAFQEALVDELRAFDEEVRRVAPLWNPNFDDGVIINFSPLWRLVPHHKPWQKELKATWDALCAGEYDWAHLAMHLWPERVVPKCATDRSLAIAHGLEDVFWMEGEDGKWKPRPIPTRPVEELVRERTSPAVKASLEDLLQAPVAPSGGGRGRPRRGHWTGGATA